MVMVREYRHLKMLKRSGRGHDPAGVTSMQPGQCAVRCPACPQPGMNLPEGWETATPATKFLYTLFIAINANFRLKRKHISSNEEDPSLSNGWSYFVLETQFKDFLHKYDKVIPQPKSTCSNHNAVNSDRSGKGLAATGVGAADCARHDCKQPLSVGDILKGERYVNMDFVFLRSLTETELVSFVVSYDIACQWSSNLWDRMKQYPRDLHVNSEGKMLFRFLVPKFHLPAHVMACQTPFLFNFNSYVGRTDGEAPECGWSHINPVAMSTQEMGPGHRRDTLDNHFGDWNWKKTCLMAPSLLRKIKEAVIESKEHHELHAEFERGLDAKAISIWQAELTAWEVDHVQPNPFEKRYKSKQRDLQEGLCLRSYLYIDKDCQQIGQIQNTHSRAIIARTQAKVDEAASTYCAARKAMMGLARTLELVGWEKNFPSLLATDIKGLTDDDPLTFSRCNHNNIKCPSEGRRTLSWIWSKLGDLGEEADLLQHDLRIQWCKSKARADRWREEVLLLLEEMNRVRRFFKHMAATWDSRLSTIFSLGRSEGGTVIPQEVVNAEQDDGDAEATITHSAPNMAVATDSHTITTIPTTVPA
ncbi:hypothetical protein H0H81_012123 [Sphagnurus paluster]|uniref:CxC2-like cysteine cluster KDZ transposase-associated domain-containing protein n=1 Tax=Sphagnurus paluster TaxID=117069 RepID=A0A9P7FND7_9AGAR|nr:hypothetical protein H0H81_012123 [Sphagnurus paluster]